MNCSKILTEAQRRAEHSGMAKAALISIGLALAGIAVALHCGWISW